MTLSFLSHDEVGRIEVDDKASLTSLISQLHDEWVPILKCELCGRNDNCNFVQPYENGDGFKEIKCGVISNFLTGVIVLSEHDFATLDVESKKKYLDAVFYLLEYAVLSDSFVAALQKPSKLIEDYGSLVGVNLIGTISETSFYLSKASLLLKDIPFVNSKRIMLLVEGESEECFVNRLKLKDAAPFPRVDVKSYGGKDNKKYSDIRQLVNEYKKQGYHVLIQVDADGKPDRLNERNYWGLKRHVDNGLISKEDIFSFSEDLEAAYPAELLSEALVDLCGFDAEQVISVMENPVSIEDTFYKRLKEDLGSIPSKLTLAQGLADRIDYDDVLYKSEFDENEIVRFMKFISGHALKI